MILINSGLSEAQFNDYHIYGFNGKVKSCNDIAYVLLPDNDTIKLGDFLSYKSGLAKYDTNRRLISLLKSSYSHYDSRQKDSTLFVYDTLGRVSMEYKYYKGLLKSKYRYDYKENGLVLEKYSCIGDTNEFMIGHKYFTLNAEGEIVSKKELDRNAYTCYKWALEERYIYNEKGLVVEQQPGSSDLDIFFYNYDSVGNLIEFKIGNFFVESYEYNTNGKLIKRFDIDENGNKILSAECEYYLNGFVSKEQWYRDQKVLKSYIYKYDFDNYGNWIHKYEIEKDLNDSIISTILTIRELIYYE